uniref:7TM GPCR serpentine receptor class x (Srx) domain-containing protein n=1 Tax=Globodera rostochiensis TaxID=31243 RepID=A0A914H9N8_GLORO
MELFFFRHAEYERLYNCTGLDIDSIPLERSVRALHVLALEAYAGKLLLQVFYIGIIDLAILWILGFFSGWANLRGAVFCSFPTLMYFMGMAAFNCCLDLVSPRFSHILFSGPRTSFWLIGCSLYAMFWALFMKPIVYSSIYFSWFFYPFIGYRTGDDQHEYEHWLHIVHDIVVAFLSPLIYLIFVAKLFYDVRKNRRQFGVVLSEMDAVQIRIFAQVFLLSLLNTFAGSLYVYMQNNDVNQWMITLVEFSWLHIHGFPPVIYLAFNKTIRTDCRLVFVKLFQRHRIGHIGGVTVVHQPITNPTNGTSPNCEFCKDYLSTSKNTFDFRICNTH